MAKKNAAAGGENRPADTLTLARSGRAYPLTMPDLYKLVATEVSIPNQALEDILSLFHYGGIVGLDEEQGQLAQLKRITKMRFELAHLCGLPLVLEGDAAPEDLTPADLTSTDLIAIQTFFLFGGTGGASPTTDTIVEPDAPVDRAGEADAE